MAPSTIFCDRDSLDITIGACIARQIERKGDVMLYPWCQTCKKGRGLRAKHPKIVERVQLQRSFALMPYSENKEVFKPAKPGPKAKYTPDTYQSHFCPRCAEKGIRRWRKHKGGLCCACHSAMKLAQDVEREEVHE